MMDVSGSGITVTDKTEEQRARAAKEGLECTETLREKFAEEKESISTIMEGIGSAIMYGNLSHAIVDGIFDVSDEAGVQMCHFLLQNGELLSV